jgi:hypothetical protein
VLEQEQVHGRLVLGDDRLAVGPAPDERDRRMDLAGGQERLVALRGVEDEDLAVLRDLLVVEAGHRGTGAHGENQRDARRRREGTIPSPGCHGHRSFSSWGLAPLPFLGGRREAASSAA